MSRDITVTVTIACPHCPERFRLGDERSLDEARDHIDRHTIGSEDEARADGG
jgi:hypothetical protein